MESVKFKTSGDSQEYNCETLKLHTLKFCTLVVIICYQSKSLTTSYSF